MSCLYSRTLFPMERSLFPFRKGPSISILWVALFVTWSMWGDQVSRVSRVSLREQVVSTHWTGSPKCFWLGLDEAPLTRKHYRSALRDVSDDSPFTQLPFAVGCSLVQCREQCNEQRDWEVLWHKMATAWFSARNRDWSGRESSCAVNLLLEMWGVPTLFKNP